MGMPWLPLPSYGPPPSYGPSYGHALAATTITKAITFLATRLPWRICVGIDIQRCVEVNSANSAHSAMKYLALVLFTHALFCAI